jgi:F0F1-type ATP synthase delta subunit
MREHYRTAVLELITAGHKPAEVVSGLRKVLARRRHEGLYLSILRSVVKYLSVTQSAKVPQVTLAKENHETTYKKAIKRHLTTLSAPADYHTVIDETIVGGVVVEYQHQRIDASYKRALKTIFERSIAH